MRRRVYLATAGAIGLAGCGAFAGEDNGDDEEGNGSDDELTIQSLDDFEDLEAWETIMGTAEATEERAYTGSQSVSLETEGAEQIRIVRTFDEPIDASGMSPGLAVAADGQVAPTVQLVDEDGDWFEFRQRVAGDVPFRRYNFGLDAVEGDPDDTAIEEIHIVRWVGDEPEDVGELLVDDLHLVPRPSDGIVTLQFAGGHRTTHSVGLPTTEEYDLTATAFVPPARLRTSEDDEGGRMTEDQVGELADAGWTIGSQSYRDLHLTGMDEDEQRDDVEQAIEWLEDNGYSAGASAFSFPGDRYDESALEAVADHHEVGFAGSYTQTGYAVSTVPTARLMNPSGQAAVEAIERTADYGGITALCFYGLEEDEEVDALEATVEAVADNRDDLDVVDALEVAEYQL